MTDVTTICCPSKESLVSYLYDEPDESASRSAVEAHLASCASCREEVAAFRAVRDELAAWSVPEWDAHVAVLTDRPPDRPWTWLLRPAFALPAAAMLVLGISAGLANLELRYGSEGFVIRTGWSREGSAAPAAPRGDRVLSSIPASLSFSPASSDDAGGRTRPSPAPWRSDLLALERQLRQEFLSAGGGRALPIGASGRDAQVDPETLRRIQALIDESEVRQQRNLALRIAELARDFDLQRKSDLVQIQQGLGRLEGRTEAEAARARELMNYIVRVSQSSAQPR